MSYASKVLFGCVSILLAQAGKAADASNFFVAPEAARTANNNKCMETLQMVMASKSGQLIVEQVRHERYLGAGATDESFAQYVQKVLHNTDSADMDSLTGSCKLIDGEIFYTIFRSGESGPRAVWKNTTAGDDGAVPGAHRLPAQASAVPELPDYAMLLAGLGGIALYARRRQR